MDPAPLACLLALLAPTLLPTESIAGVWKGDIRTPQGPLGVVMHVEPDGAGGWTGTADTPSQGAWGIPLDGIEFDEGAFAMEIPLTAARYTAELSSDGTHLIGDWIQSGMTLPLECERLPPVEPVSPTLRQATEGIWEGLLAAGPVELRVRLQLAARDDGALRGSFVSPDQSPVAHPVTRTDALGDRGLRVCVGSVVLALEVELSEDGSQLAGTFQQGAASIPITLTRVERATELVRPQHPVPPFPYRTEEVRFPGGAEGVTLAGTLTLPAGDGPHPAALLISGSGAQDRDETIFEHKPFWVLADHLTRSGVAVLRVDDRGVGESTAGPNPSAETSADYADDARAAVAFLRTRSEVRSIGLIGHSEGGVIAPLVAADDPEIAFIVLLAGPGVTGADLLYMQVEAINRASGISGPELEQGLALQRTLMDTVADTSLSPAELASKLRATLEGDPSFAELEDAQAAVDTALAQLQVPWVLWFIRHDPAPVLARVTCPVLALLGERDLQVPSAPNAAALRAALEAGGNEDFEVHELERLNHLFQHAETGLIAEYGKLEETFAPQALVRIADWLGRRFVD